MSRLSTAMEARALLEGHWTKHIRSQERVMPNGTTEQYYCALGALMEVAPDRDMACDLRVRLLHVVLDTTDFDSIADFNDSDYTTEEDVLDKFDLLIEQLSQPVANASKRVEAES